MVSMFPEIPETTTRAERLDAILIVLSNSDIPLPLRVISARLGLKVTPYTRDLMAKLCQDGNVSADLQRANGFDVHFYQLTSDGAAVVAKIKAGRENDLS